MRSELSNDDLADIAKWVRLKVLDMCEKTGAGHVTTAFSQTEMLVALYCGGILRHDPKDPNWDGRDRFILSKGQGGVGLYPILANRGFFPAGDLDNFCGPGSHLGVHSEWHTPGIEILTGSLGHGLPIATGMCQAAIHDKKDHLVFVMLGDGELYEGSNWEAAIFAGSQGYDNLVCIVDRNSQATLGYTDGHLDGLKSDGPRLNSLQEKFKAFGFEVRNVNGHDYEDIKTVFADIRGREGQGPLMVISNTEKGYGAPSIAGKRLWHYRVPKGGEMERVREEVLNGEV